LLFIIAAVSDAFLVTLKAFQLVLSSGES